MRTLFLTVLIHHEGWRLDKFLTQSIADFSRTWLQQLIREGHVSLEGGVCLSPSHPVKVGEVYALTIPPVQPMSLEAQPMDLVIVYEDEDVLVIDKPAGLIVHPGAGQPDRTLVNGLLAHCGKALSGISGVQRPGIVHRLDKGTSGLLVVAKHDHAHQALSIQFADRSLSRVYTAFVWGVPVPLRGEINRPIGRHPIDRQRMAVRTHGGKPAITHYQTEQTYAHRASMITCQLETGRTHQIRVHLAALGHAVLGDPTYGHLPRGTTAVLKAGLESILKPGRQALHAQSLHLTHPRTRERLFFQSPLPEDLVKLEAFLKT